MFYDGVNIFGYSVTCIMEQHVSEVQLNTFFGSGGIQGLYGGSRGRTFTITGLLVGSNMSDLAAARELMLSYDDGIARTLEDTMGVSWPAVVFQHFQQTGRVEFLAGGLGLCFPYRATFLGRL